MSFRAPDWEDLHRTVRREYRVAFCTLYGDWDEVAWKAVQALQAFFASESLTAVACKVGSLEGCAGTASFLRK